MLSAKIEQWKNAGLIDAGTARRILEFENGRSRPKVLYAVGGMGALAVGLGVMALIASNWETISSSIKLFSLFAISAALAALVMRPESTFGSRWLREMAILLYAAITLGGYALIGQIYHLRGVLSETLGIWCLVTTPLFWQARGVYVATLWTTFAFGILAFFYSEHAAWFDSYTNAVLVLTSLHVIPLLLLTAGQEPLVEKRAPNFARAFFRLGGTTLLATGTFGQILWHTGSLDHTLIGLVPSLALVCVALALFVLRQRMLGRGSVWEVALAAYCIITPYVPIALGLRSEVMGAVGFIALWSLTARVAYLRQDGRLFNFATGLVGMRLFVLYAQQIGGFLGTGLGLVGGGLLLLGLTWLWMKKSRTVTRGWHDERGSR